MDIIATWKSETPAEDVYSIPANGTAIIPVATGLWRVTHNSNRWGTKEYWASDSRSAAMYERLHEPLRLEMSGHGVATVERLERLDWRHGEYDQSYSDEYDRLLVGLPVYHQKQPYTATPVLIYMTDDGAIKSAQRLAKGSWDIRDLGRVADAERVLGHAATMRAVFGSHDA